MTDKVGTLYYIAPEILHKKNLPYTEKCDIWSVGVMCYILLTGRSPFEVKNIFELRNKIQTEE